MESTITQNGALYVLQHGAIKKIRSMNKNRAIETKVIIRAINARSETSAAQKTKTEEVCFI
jgi:hypothetical protein